MPQECQLCGLFQRSPCCLYFNWAWPLEAVSPDGADGVFPPFSVFLSFTFSHCIFFTRRGESPSSACGSFSSKYVAIDEPLSDWVQMISLMESPTRNGYYSYQAVIILFLILLFHFFLLLLSLFYLKMPDCAFRMSIMCYAWSHVLSFHRRILYWFHRCFIGYYFSRLWEGYLSHLSSCWGINTMSLDRKWRLELHAHKLQSEMWRNISVVLGTCGPGRDSDGGQSRKKDFGRNLFFSLIDSC